MQPVLSIQPGTAASSEAWASHLEAASRAGFRALELPADTPAEHISQAGQQGLRIAALRSTLSVPGAADDACSVQPRAPRPDPLVQVIERAETLECRLLTVTPRRDPVTSCDAYHLQYPEALRAMLLRLRSLVVPAAACGVALALECPAQGFLLSPVECREFLDLLNAADVGACLQVPAAARLGWLEDWLGTLGYRMICARLGDGGAADIAAAADTLAGTEYMGPAILAGDPQIAGRLAGRLNSDDKM